MSAQARRSAAVTHAGESLARVTAALEQTMGPGRQAGAWTKYCCPVHEASPGHHDPSLIVKHFADAGRTKVQCQAGCPDEQILESLGLQVRDLYDEPITRAAGGRQRGPVRPRPTQRPATPADRAIAAAGLPLTKPKKDLGPQTGSAKAVASYVYRDRDGQVVGEVVRKHIPHEHGRGKEFYQLRRDPAAGRMEPGGFAPIPYRLPEVLAAVAEGRTVYIAEGEEDVNAAWHSGVPATCNAAGAGKWRPEHAQWLAGARRVVVIADRDAPGYRHAAKVAETLAGLVGEVRIVAAADGKDLRDHFAAGHELGELEPVAGLDFRTPITSAARPEAGAVPFASEIAAAAAITPDGGSLMTGNSTANLSGLHSQDGGHQHDDTIDRIGSQFAVLLRALMQEVVSRATASATARRAAIEAMQMREEKARREHAAQVAAQCKAVETALAKARKAGWDRLSRSEVAAALQEAVEWSGESEPARKAAVELAGHIRERWGVHVDLDGGHVTIDATPEMLAKMVAAEQDRAGASRLVTAQNRMAEIVAAENIDESKKAELYAEIEEWRKAPSPHRLSMLTKKMEAAGIGQDTRTRTEFVALYLGGPAYAPVTRSELGSGASAAAATALRKMTEVVVDPGEEVKNRVDTMLLDYQVRLKAGWDTTGVQARLARAVALMNPADQETARDRGKEIRKNPAGVYKPVWPQHVDRDELAATVRAYAALAPVVTDRVAREDGLDAEWAVAQKDRAEVMRAQIDRAIKSGKGLTSIERDQLRAVVTDIEAGKTAVPDMLFADDRSTAALTLDRSDEIARATASHSSHRLEKILSSTAVPEGAARRVREEITRVVDEQTRLAAGRINLPDYEITEADERLLAGLAANGVPEQVRNQVRGHLAETREEAAITGRQARRIQDRWADRSDKVAEGRAPAPGQPGYDSPERRALLEHNLRQAGLSPDEIRQCMAAEKGRAKPPAAAVQQPAPPQRAPRVTAPGAGIQQTHHRGPGQAPGGVEL